MLISNVEYGVRELMHTTQRPDGCGSAQELIRVVVDSTGIPIAAAIKLRPVFSRVAHVLDRMCECLGVGVWRALALAVWAQWQASPS